MTSVNDLKNVEELRKLIKDVSKEFLNEIYECAFSVDKRFFSGVYLQYPNERRSELFKKGYKLAKKVEDYANQALFAGWIAWDNMYLGNMDKALPLAKEAVALDRKTRNVSHLPNSLGTLGCINVILGEWDKSEQYFKEAFRISQEQNEKYLNTNRHWWLGWLHFEKEEYVKATEHLKKAYEISKMAEEDELGQMDTGQYYIWYIIELGEIEKAKNLIDDMEKLAVKTEQKEFLAVVDALRGMLFRAQKKWDESIKHFEMSLKKHEALNARRYIVYLFTKMVLIEYARVYMERNQKGDKEKANSLLDEALEIFQRLGAKKEIEKIMEKKKRLKL